MPKSAQRWVPTGLPAQEGGFQQGLQQGFQRIKGVPARFQQRVPAQRGVPARVSSRGSGTRGGGGAQKNLRCHRFFVLPPPLGGGKARKKNIPPLCVKKFRNPNFFLKNTTSCFFILCKRSLHKALRTPNIPYFAGTNLVPLRIPVGPKFSHHKARVLAVGPQEFWLGVKLVKMTLLF